MCHIQSNSFHHLGALRVLNQVSLKQGKNGTKQQHGGTSAGSPSKKNKWLFDLRRLWTPGKRISIRSFKSIKSHLLVSLWKRLIKSIINQHLFHPLPHKFQRRTNQRVQPQVEQATLSRSKVSLGTSAFKGPKCCKFTIQLNGNDITHPTYRIEWPIYSQRTHQRLEPKVPCASTDANFSTVASCAGKFICPQS